MCSRTTEPDPVEYTVTIRHWQDGDIDVRVNDVDSDERSRASIAHALRQAADLVEQGQPIDLQRFS